MIFNGVRTMTKLRIMENNIRPNSVPEVRPMLAIAKMAAMIKQAIPIALASVVCFCNHTDTLLEFESCAFWEV